MALRARIEAGFTSWGHFVVRWRWLCVAGCAALSLLLVWRLPEFRVDNSDESFLHADDPTRLRYDEFRERFGRDDRLVVVVHPPAVFDLGFLEKLRALHREIEREVPYVSEVTSLVNARNTRGEGDELIVEDLMQDWPGDEVDLAALRRRVLANPLYQNVLIAGDRDHTLISIEPFTYSTRGPEADALAGFGAEGGSGNGAPPPYLSEEEGFQLMEALQAVVRRHEAPDFQTYLVGSIVFDYHVFGKLQEDVTLLMALSNLVILVLLYLVFRRISAVALPLIVVVSAMLSTMGLMVWLDIPFSVTLNMLPAFLLVVGVCDSIHILTIVYRRLAAGRSREDAIADALGHSGLAVVMTSVTTAFGLLSFSVAEIAPIAQLGVLAPAGVMLALLYSLVLLPALLSVSPLARRATERAGGGAVDALLTRVGDLATRRPWAVVAATALLALLALPGVLAVRFSHDGRAWLPDGDVLKEAWLLLDREFEGAETLEVLVDTGGENGLHEPETLRRIERAMRHSETLRVAGEPVNKAISIVDVLKETHQALNENRAEFYVLPEERRLIAQELLLFENSGSDDLGDVTDSQFRTGRITIRTRTADALAYPEFLEGLARDLSPILGDELSFEFTGGLTLFSRAFQAVLRSMARSYVFALVLITPTIVLLIGSLRRGLVAMIPNLIPIYLILGLMGWTGIPLDASTLLIGGVIIGLAVDDTIHFMHKFGRYYEDWGDPIRAVHETLATTGSALFFTSLVLCSGFLVFLAAYMRNTFWFGLLVSSGALVAFLADVLLGPALMVLVTGRRVPKAEPLPEATAG